jgi:site-specific DNA-methyltransferase (adenine-specific)
VESSNFRVNQMLVWDKLSYGLGRGFRAQHELVLHASKGTPTVYAKDTGNVLRHKRDKNTVHPAPKPVALLEQLLRVVAHRGDQVLDPFAGDGSTLVAAKRLGLRAIGIEIEARYCETAARRLTATTPTEEAA